MKTAKESASETENRPPPERPPDAKTCDGLKGTATGVIDGIDLELCENMRRNPPTANLGAWEVPLVKDDHVESGIPQTPGAGRSRGTASDDQDIAGIHLQNAHNGTRRKRFIAQRRPTRPRRLEFSVGIQGGPRPWLERRIGAREAHLKQLQRAGAEARD